MLYKLKGDHINRLNEKVVVITGAGSGIGKETAIIFAREGAKVVCSDYNENTANETANIIRNEGKEAISVKVDISNWEDIDNMINQTLSNYGKLDVIINNAGIFDDFKTLLDTDEELWNRVINTNLKGIFYGCKRAVQEFLKQNSNGNIINVASVASLGAMAGGISYTSSKHGVIGITKQVACEYATKGIRVNAICPGGIGKTGMTQPFMEDKEIEKIITSKVPMSRWGKTEEVSNLLLFLASDDSSFITGTCIRVDGGWRS